MISNHPPTHLEQTSSKAAWTPPVASMRVTAASGNFSMGTDRSSGSNSSERESSLIRPRSFPGRSGTSCQLESKHFGNREITVSHTDTHFIGSRVGLPGGLQALWINHCIRQLYSPQPLPCACAAVFSSARGITIASAGALQRPTKSAT
jgi:hypothetical protein